MNDKFYEDSSGRSKIMRHFEKNGGGGGGGGAAQLDPPLLTFLLSQPLFVLVAQRFLPYQ